MGEIEDLMQRTGLSYTEARDAIAIRHGERSGDIIIDPPDDLWADEVRLPLPPIEFAEEKPPIIVESKPEPKRRVSKIIRDPDTGRIESIVTEEAE